MPFTDDQKRMLSGKLDAKNVVKPDSNFGPKGDYIYAWHAIDEANSIFGFDKWSYTADKLELCCEPVQNNKGNWVVSYIAIVTVSVEGVHRQDVGYGSGASKQIGDAHENATKEAVTDALKRSLRTFGNKFGLALYDKKRENVGDSSKEETSDAVSNGDEFIQEKKRTKTSSENLTDIAELRGWLKCAIPFWKSGGLSESQREELIAIVTARTKEIEEANNSSGVAT